MKPWKTLATSGVFTLRQRDREFMVLEQGKIVLTSRTNGTEEDVARIAFARLDTHSPRVLVGGLGFGVLLRAVLDRCPDLGEVIVNEPWAPLVEWQHGPLGVLNGNSLEDPRVSVETDDVQVTLSDHRKGFDVILLDLDNSPYAVDVKDDMSLYSIGGLSSVRASLRPGGRVVVASAATHPGFNKRLTAVGLQASVEPLGAGHLVFIGDA
jgi:spermidine synthase